RRHIQHQGARRGAHSVCRYVTRKITTPPDDLVVHNQLIRVHAFVRARFACQENNLTLRCAHCIRWHFSLVGSNQEGRLRAINNRYAYLPVRSELRGSFVDSLLRYQFSYLLGLVQRADWLFGYSHKSALPAHFLLTPTYEGIYA